MHRSHGSSLPPRLTDDRLVELQVLTSRSPAFLDLVPRINQGFGYFVRDAPQAFEPFLEFLQHAYD